MERIRTPTRGSWQTPCACSFVVCVALYKCTRSLFVLVCQMVSSDWLVVLTPTLLLEFRCMFFWESTNLVAGTVRLTQKTLECFPCGFVPCGGGGDAIKTSRSYLSCPFGSEKFFISFLFFKTYYYNSKLLVFCQYLFSPSIP